MKKGSLWNSTFIFVGPAFSGVSTLSTLLSQEAVMSTKDSTAVRVFKLQNEISRYSEKLLEVPKKVRDMHTVFGVPKFVADLLVGNFATHTLKEDCTIFDGYPQNLVEAMNLDEILRFTNKTKAKIMVFNLVVGSDDIIKRIDASNKTTMRDRVLAQNSIWFCKNGSEVVNFYKENPAYKVVDLDASEGIGEVFHNLMVEVREHFSL